MDAIQSRLVSPTPRTPARAPVATEQDPAHPADVFALSASPGAPAPSIPGTPPTSTAPAPSAAASPSSSARLPLQPYTRATRFTRDGAGHGLRQQGHFVRERATSRMDSSGQTWQAFEAIERSVVVRVTDGQGNVRLNFDCGSTLGKSTEGGWIREMALDPDRRRLYVLTNDALRGFDLDAGTEVGCIRRAVQHDLAAIHVARDGRLFSTQKNALLELTPDLREVRRVPVTGFVPESISDLPSGDVVVSGALVEEGGRVLQG